MILSGAIFGAVWISGFFQAFAENRGFLQLVVAIPLATLLSSGILASTRILTRAQLLWGMPPVALLIVLVSGGMGLEPATWPWMLGASLAAFVPWTVGTLVGSWLARRRG